MTIAKSITKTLDISVEDVRIDLTATIRSYDLTDTQFIFEIKSSNGMTANLTGSTAMYIVEYVHNSQTYAIQGDIDIIGTDTLSFNLPEDLKGYSGTVLIGIYVKLTDGTKIDIKDIAVRIEPSIMDKDIDFTAKTYFKDFESVKAEVILEGEKAKTQIKQVLPSVQSVGETAKTQINAVVSDVNGYADTQKQIINNFVTDVQSTGEKAKTDINAVLPSVKAEISEIKTEIENLPEIPDLFVAYADDINGGGFSKTDTTKLYKGFGVKNSNLPSDYRWERNADSLRVGGRNLLKNTASDLYNRKITKDRIGGRSETLYLVDGFNLNNLINKTVVLSFRLKNDGNSEVLNNGNQTYLNDRFGAHAGIVWRNSTTGQTHTISPMTDLLYMKENNKRVYAVYTFTPPDSSYDTLYSLVFHMQFGCKPTQDNDSEWFLGEFKLEIGNTPTDWSPAPEDQVSQVEFNELKSYIGYTDKDVYGVEIDMTNKTFKRLSASIGKNAGADFDNVKALGGRRRCNITDDGIVLSYYGDSNYTESGLTTVEITKNNVKYPINTPVQTLVEQPKFYYKVVPLTLEQIANGKGYHMRKVRYYISDYPKEGFKVHPAFVRNGVERDKIYLPAFEGSIFDTSASSYLLNDEQVADFSADKLSSVANAKPCSGLTQNLSRANVRLLAHNRGNGWEQQTIQTVSLTQLLFLIEYNTFNMQTAIGMGATQKTDDGRTNMAENTGGTSSLGNASGAVTNSNGIQIVSYRGEENPFGNIWKFVDGINVMANGIHAAYVADHDFNDKQSTGSYADVGFTLAKTYGYVSAFGYSQEFDWLFLTSETTGSSSVPVGDYFYQEYAATDDGGWRNVRLGASWSDGSGAGGFYWLVGYPSVDRSRFLSGRLVYLGG